MIESVTFTEDIETDLLKSLKLQSLHTFGKQSTDSYKNHLSTGQSVIRNDTEFNLEDFEKNFSQLGIQCIRASEKSVKEKEESVNFYRIQKKKFENFVKSVEQNLRQSRLQVQQIMQEQQQFKRNINKYLQNFMKKWQNQSKCFISVSQHSKQIKKLSLELKKKQIQIQFLKDEIQDIRKSNYKKEESLKQILKFKQAQWEVKLNQIHKQIKQCNRKKLIEDLHIKNFDRIRSPKTQYSEPLSQRSTPSSQRSLNLNFSKVSRYQNAFYKEKGLISERECRTPQLVSGNISSENLKQKVLSLKLKSRKTSAEYVSQKIKNFQNSIRKEMNEISH